MEDAPLSDPQIPASRLPLLRPEELSPQQHELYEELAGGKRAEGPFTIVGDQGRLYGPFNAFLHSPTIGNALQQLGQSIRFGGSLDNRTRELIICLVGGIKECPYEIYAHTRVGRISGISEQELTELALGRIPATVDATERSLLKLVAEVIENNDIREELWTAAVTQSGESIVVESLAVAGYYLTLSMILNAAATEAPQD